MSNGETLVFIGPESVDRERFRCVGEELDFSVATFDGYSDFVAGSEISELTCVVVDVTDSCDVGMKVLSEIRERGLSTPTVFLTSRGDVRTAVQAVRCGAFDVMEKSSEVKTLLLRIRAALRQLDSTREERERVAKIRRRLASLTTREREVLNLVVGGLANREVAARLKLSEKTIEVHRAHVMRKLHADTIADLVRIAILGGSRSGGDHS